MDRDKDMDKIGRVLKGPVQIAWDITNRCNFRCLHCFNLSGPGLPRNELHDDEVIQIARRDIAGTKPMGVCLCGGEPLLRKDLLLQVTEILTAYNINVSMVTNGFLLNRATAKQLSEAGMRFVQVSLDGATKETHEKLRGVEGSFDKAVEALENLKGEPIETAIAFCPTKFNIDEFECCVDIAYELGCHRVRVQPLMIMGNALVNADILRPTAEQYRKLVEIIRLRTATKPGTVDIEWGDPVFHFRQLDHLSLLYTEIKSDGSIAISAYLPVFLGNLRKHSLLEYWEAGLYQAGKLPVVQELAQRIKSVEDLSRIDPIPFYEYGDYIRFDLIDDRDRAFSFKVKDFMQKHIVLKKIIA